MSIPSYPEQPPVPPSRGNRSLLFISGILGGVILVVCCGACTGLTLFVRGTSRVVVKNAQKIVDEINEIRAERAEREKLLFPALARSITSAESFPPVAGPLGTPLDLGEYHKVPREDTLRPEGEIVEFEIVGPKAKAVMKTLAVKDDKGIWQPTQVSVTFLDGTVVAVPDPPRIAPGWPPAK